MAALLVGGCQLFLDVGPSNDAGNADADGSTATTGAAGSDASPGSDGSLAADAGSGSLEDAQSPPPCDQKLDCERVVFVTSLAYDGAMNGVAGADNHCNELASKASHPRVKGRTYTAWLSGTEGSPWQRLKMGTKPYVRPDGNVIADDWHALASAMHRLPINQNEYGELTTDDVWTGTDDDGTLLTGLCGSWVVRDGGLGAIGSSSSSAAGWSNAGTKPCGMLARLYCIER